MSSDESKKGDIISFLKSVKNNNCMSIGVIAGASGLSYYKAKKLINELYLDNEINRIVSLRSVKYEAKT